MAIKGLTTQGGASLPEIGKLRKGGKKPTKGPGKDLTYFRFDSKDQKAIADFHSAYGDEPTEVNVLLLSDDIEECFYTCKEEWAAGGLVHRCDGEHVTAIRVGNVIQRQFMAPIACPGNCKEIGRLKVLIPELSRFAYITVETHSINDIVNLHKQLSAVQMTFGQLRNIPFVLRRVPMEISCPNGDSRARREKWMLSIEVDPVWSEQRIGAMRAIALQEARMEQAIALPSPAQRIALPSAKPEPTNSYLGSDCWQQFKSGITRAEQDTDPFGKMQILQEWAFKQLAKGALPENAIFAVEKQISEALQRISDRNGQPLPKIPEREALTVEAVTADLDEF